MKSDAIITSQSDVFEVLPGLPGVGPLPEPFAASGQGTHSEGFVVRFHPASGDPWVGNFQPGICGYDGVLMHPDGRTVIVVSGGQAYQIDPRSRACLRHFGGCISAVVRDDTRRLVVLADLTRLWLLDAARERWVSERVSLDGIRNLRIEAESVVGEDYDPMSDHWHPFSVSLETGRLQRRVRRFFRW